MKTMREEASTIIYQSIQAVLPDAAVQKALKGRKLKDKLVIVSIGKAAWNMASAAYELLRDKEISGIVITKYKHSRGPIGDLEIIEAGHPIPDENSVCGANKALELVANLGQDAQILFLISGGGSALFEKPMSGLGLEDIMDVTRQLLACGANIVEVNTMRKHLSAVKGGRFALACKNNRILSIVLSDVVGDHLDTIASGPTYPDSSTSEDAFGIVEKYGLKLREPILEALRYETPKEIYNCETVITGSVRELCFHAAQTAKELGYEPTILTTVLDCEAKEAGRFLGAIAKDVQAGTSSFHTPCAIIAGGETVVTINGTGKGGRNQELVLSAAFEIQGLEDVVIFSVGSDGTDGPTDAAGGMVDGHTIDRIREAGLDPIALLKNNDSFTGLKVASDHVITGPTGTNVNDIAVVLCK